MALLLVASAAGCNSGDPILGTGGRSAGAPPDTTAPRVINTGVATGTTGLPTNRSATATFSEAMRSSTIISSTPSTAAGTTFTVCSTASNGGACVTSVAGVVTYVGNTATFKPDVALAASTWYKSTVSTAAKDVAGNALAAGTVANPWWWQTGLGPDNIQPVINVTNPAHLATGVAVNRAVNATFNEAMSQATMITANFTLKETVSLNSVAGGVSYDVQNNIATFTPLSDLKPDTDYTATVTSGAQDLSGNALNAVSPATNPWTFRTALATAPLVPLAINLRGAASFGIASQAGMTSSGVTVVNGDVALYPLAGCTDSTGNGGASQSCLVKTYASPTGLTVNGSIYYAGDPFDNGGTANSVTNDLNIAWIEGKNKVDTFATSFLGGQLAGKTLTSGVYHETVLNLAAGGICTFDAAGDANAVFIVKVNSAFTDSGIDINPSQIALANGAQARNIWFVVGGAATIGTGTTWNGNILAGGTISISGGSTVNGRLLAGAAGAGAFTMTTTPPSTPITINVPL